MTMPLKCHARSVPNLAYPLEYRFAENPRQELQLNELRGQDRAYLSCLSCRTGKQEVNYRTLAPSCIGQVCTAAFAADSSDDRHQRRHD
jgi:hypothetical protein